MPIIDQLNARGISVAVLCGGPGGEREVSLASGENAYQALCGTGLNVRKIEVPAENPGAFLEQVDCRIAVMMFHGEFGEDGTAQAILERRGIAFTGSDSRVCALSMDKNACKKIFVAEGVPTQPWIVSDSPETAARAIETAGLRYPLFVKPNYGGSSVGVSRVEKPEQLPDAVRKTLGIDRLAMIEEMVVGRELTVGWLGGRVLPIIEMRADGVFYDYNAKYVSSATQYTCPADLPEELTERIMADTAKVVAGIGVRDVARVDVMLGQEGPRFLELNALPGFTSHSLLPMAAKAVGMEVEAVCVSLVEMASKRAGIV